MASSSGRRSSSSGRSTTRRRVVIGAEETTRVSYRNDDTPQVESKRRDGRGTRRGGDAAAASSPGRRLSNAKRAERERRRKVARTRMLLRAGAAILVAVASIWCVVQIYNAPIFRVTSIVVVGADRLDPSLVKSYAAKAGVSTPSDKTLLNAPLDKVATEVGRNPWVREVVVDRDFPHTLRIVLTERKALALVEVVRPLQSDGKPARWLVSSDMRWLQKAEKRDSKLAVIRDLPPMSPSAGRGVSTAGAGAVLRNALLVLKGSGTRAGNELRKRVVSVSAPSVDETALRTRSNVVIFVGKAQSLARKESIALNILKSQKDVVQINVRVYGKETWRGLESE